MTAIAPPIMPADVSRAQFEKEGYLCPVPVLSPAETRHYYDLYMAFYAKHKQALDSRKPSEKWQITSDTHFVFEWVDELTRHPKILDAVERVLGPNLLAWNTNWFTKMPGDKTFVSWHQDGSYWGLSPVEVATAWVALGPANANNGCMRIVPGTHQKPNMPQRETYAEDNALSRGQEISAKVNEADAVDLVLKAGEMSLHHIWIVHGSNANKSNIPRIGIAIRYLSTRVKQDSPGKPFAMLVRGKDEYNHFHHMERPVGNDATAGEGKHADVLARIRASIMQGAAGAKKA